MHWRSIERVSRALVYALYDTYVLRLYCMPHFVYVCFLSWFHFSCMCFSLACTCDLRMRKNNKYVPNTPLSLILDTPLETSPKGLAGLHVWPIISFFITEKSLYNALTYLCYTLETSDVEVRQYSLVYYAVTERSTFTFLKSSQCGTEPVCIAF